MGWFTEYKRSLKLIEVEEIFDLSFYRPLAFLIVKLVYPTRITPNQLTINSIILGIASGILYGTGKPDLILVGAALYVLSNIFDCSDGQLARLKHNGTAVGRIIDGMADFTVMVAVMTGIGFGYANHTGEPAFWWLMILASLLSCVIHDILVDFYRNRFLDYYMNRKSDFEEDLSVYKNAYNQAKQEKGKGIERFILYIYLIFSALQRIVVARRKTSRPLVATPETYYRKNRLILWLWLLIGPTTQITIVVICSIFQRFDLFIWIVLFGFNGLAIILWIVQQLIDQTLKTRSR